MRITGPPMWKQCVESSVALFFLTLKKVYWSITSIEKCVQITVYSLTNYPYLIWASCSQLCSSYFPCDWKYVEFAYTSRDYNIKFMHCMCISICMFVICRYTNIQHAYKQINFLMSIKLSYATSIQIKISTIDCHRIVYMLSF